MNNNIDQGLENAPENRPEYKVGYLRWAIWAPPLVLATILLLILIYLLIPGSLIYPARINLDNSVQIEKGTNNELQQNLTTRISELETLLSDGQCTADGLTVPEEGLSLLPPSQITNDNKDDRIALLPPADQLLSSQANVSLSEFLTKSVVFVAADDGFGTGFFIDENKIVTNRHVVENAKGVVRVFRPNGVEAFEATVMELSDEFTESNEDFAILLSSAPSSNFLKFAAKSDNLSLMPVISAGYPGDVLDTILEIDQNGEGLLGDGIPLFLTNGVINAVQKFKDQGAILLHSADISQGNSGGPLLNACGEVLGVNTFTRSDDVRTLNIALRADGLVGFLNRFGFAIKRSEVQCRPKILSQIDN